MYVSPQSDIIFQKFYESARRYKVKRMKKALVCQSKTNELVLIIQGTFSSFHFMIISYIQ